MTRLPKELWNQLLAVKEDLRSCLDEGRQYADGMSDRWKEGDRGKAHEAWLDTMEAACDAMADFGAAVTSAL